MSDHKNITRFGLIRHAETVWNLQNRIQGHNDSPLTAKGERQATRWGQALKDVQWDRILASDSGRALVTASRINNTLQIPLTSEPRLREQHWGQWTGKTVAQIETQASQLLAEQTKAGWKFRPPGGEDRLNIWQRSHSALVEAADKWSGESILIVTHEGVIKSLIYRLYGRQFLPHEPPLIKAFHLHWLIHNPQGLKLEKVNAIALV
jgi:probable phosphoglycerate mutase